MSCNSSDLGPWDHNILNSDIFKILSKETFPSMNKWRKTNKEASSHFLPLIPKITPQKNERLLSLEIKLKKHDESNSKILTEKDEIIDSSKLKEKKPISLKESMMKKRELYIPKIKEKLTETFCVTTKSIFSFDHSTKNNEDNKIKKTIANTNMEQKIINPFFKSRQETNRKNKSEVRDIWMIKGFEAPLYHKSSLSKKFKNFETNKKQENEAVSFTKKLKITMKAINLLKNILDNSEKQAKYKIR